MQSNMITVTLKKSLIGTTKKQQETVKALKLKKLGQSRTLQLNSSIQGMINIISHLVNIEYQK